MVVFGLILQYFLYSTSVFKYWATGNPKSCFLDPSDGFLTKAEVRKEEKFEGIGLIETRIFNYHSNLDNPEFIDIKDIDRYK